jgi:putative transposase
MPRPPRDTEAGTFHIFTHCVWAAPAHFRDDVDRLNFLRDLARVTVKAKWTCIAFCMMTTHYHLIVDVLDGVLPVAMHALNLSYVRDFNRRHALRGHAQFHRYGSRRIQDDDDLLETFAYVARNPVEAGMCAFPSEWQWSSYAATVGLSERHSFVDDARLLACFRWPDVDPRAALRAHVDKS